jgi:rubredoxin
MTREVCEACGNPPGVGGHLAYGALDEDGTEVAVCFGCPDDRRLRLRRLLRLRPGLGAGGRGGVAMTASRIDNDLPDWMLDDPSTFVDWDDRETRVAEGWDDEDWMTGTLNFEAYALSMSCKHCGARARIVERTDRGLQMRITHDEGCLVVAEAVR